MTINKLAMIINSSIIFICNCNLSCIFFNFCLFVFYNLFVSIVVVFYFMSLSRPSFVSYCVEVCASVENMEHG